MIQSCWQSDDGCYRANAVTGSRLGMTLNAVTGAIANPELVLIPRDCSCCLTIAYFLTVALL